MTKDIAKFIARCEADKEFVYDIATGECLFLPSKDMGSMTPWMLRTIADELDRCNRPK